MKVVLDISENYTGFTQEFEELPAMLMALRKYDIRCNKDKPYKSLDDIAEKQWFRYWFDNTTDHVIKNGEAIGITKKRYYAYVIDMKDIAVFLLLVADKEFSIVVSKTDFVEVEYKISLL